jgi:hypothetical protein
MKITICILCCIVLVSCQRKTEKKFDKLEKMNWLLGHWEQQLPDGLLIEDWKKVNDSTYSGNSYFITPKDTVHFENIKLVQKEDQLTYSATVKGQNNDEPIDFKQTIDSGNIVTFENPSHDYPQNITYKKVNETHLIATISGKQQGKVSQESYPMTKK